MAPYERAPTAHFASNRTVAVLAPTSAQGAREVQDMKQLRLITGKPLIAIAISQCAGPSSHNHLLPPDA
jgi:hypothetical protein